MENDEINNDSQNNDDTSPFDSNQIDVNNLNDDLSQDEELEKPKRFDSELKNKIKYFVSMYKSRKYYRLLPQIKHDKGSSITIDFDDIMLYDNTLYKSLLEDPNEFLETIKDVIFEIDTENNIGYFNDKKYFTVKLHGYPNYVPIADIDVMRNNELISIRGNISRLSQKKPYIYRFYHWCKRCDYEEYSTKSSRLCPRCESHPEMRLDKDKHVYTNCYYVKIQELNEDLKGQVPHQVECLVLGDNCNNIKAGQKINATGFVKLTEIIGSMSKHTPYSIQLVANNIEPFKTNIFTNDEIKLTDKEKEKIRERLKDRKRFLNTLIASYAPHVLGNYYTKLSLLLAIVGSDDVSIDGTSLRDRINVLLVGDPSTGKTEMLKFGARITLGSVYVSGRGVTGGGLTAILQKEKDGTFSIQPGALIFANKSVFFFDEAAQTSDETKSHLHEAMESGTVSMAKGGHIVTLQADATVVFGANPKHSRYAQDLSLSENINMPDTILSRFDIIHVILDYIDKDNDRRISKHIDYLMTEKKMPVYEDDLLTIDELVKYLNFVNEEDLSPMFDKDVLKENEEYYVNMRQKSTANSIAFTPRQKYGLMRIQLAIARMTLSETVDKFIGDLGRDLMTKMIDTVMRDAEGNINVVQTEGKTIQKLQGTRLMINVLESLVDDYPPGKIPKDKIRQLLMDDHNMKEKQVEITLMQMSDQGLIQHTSEKYVRFTRGN